MIILELLSSNRVVSPEWIFHYGICGTYYTNHRIIYIIGFITGPRHDFVPLKRHEIVAVWVVMHMVSDRVVLKQATFNQVIGTHAKTGDVRKADRWLGIMVMAPPWGHEP